MSRILIVCVTLALSPVAALADNGADRLTQMDKADATAAIEKEKDYSKLLAQLPVDPGIPKVKDLVGYLLDEINHHSAMRAQIADELQDIQENGHNDGLLIEFRAPDMSYATYFEFKSANVALKLVEKNDTTFNYRAILTASNGYHGGSEDIQFKFFFKVKVTYLPVPKLFNLEVVSYPKYEGKVEIDHPDK